MDIRAELKENKRKLDDGEIDEDEFNKHKKLLLNAWSDESKKSGKTDANKPKETDLYDILQLKPNATKAEIKSSYKKLALKYHPDKNGGIETEEWSKLLRAYQILSDENSRLLYDNYGTINNSLTGKASFNTYVGGDSWLPYIGNLEIGLWLFSFVDDSVKNLTSTEQKECRHDIRVSSIVRHLQGKLQQFPKNRNDTLFKESLQEEAQKLSVENNGKELLSSLGEIYISEALDYLNKSSIEENSSGFTKNMGFLASYSFSFIKHAKFFAELFSGFLPFRTNNKPKQEEANKLIWKLSRSEVSSIARETCKKVLNDDRYNEDESHHIANSMIFLGGIWLDANK